MCVGFFFVCVWGGGGGEACFPTVTNNSPALTASTGLVSDCREADQSVYWVFESFCLFLLGFQGSESKRVPLMRTMFVLPAPNTREI